MKKTFIGLFAGLLFVSCANNSGKQGPYIILNNTSDNLTCYITADTYAPQTKLISGQTKEVLDINYYIPSVNVVKNGSELNNVSNKFKVQRSGFDIFINESVKKDYVIKIPYPEVFIPGTDYFLCERNNKMSLWSEDQNKVTPVNNANITVYTDKPIFYIYSEIGGVETKNTLIAEITNDGFIKIY